MIRYGSYTSSRVSGSSPTATASELTRRPGPPPELHDDRFEDALVHFVEAVLRRSRASPAPGRRWRRDAAVALDLGVIPHAAQEVVGDARGAAAAPGDLDRAAGSSISMFSRRAERRTIGLQLFGAVVIEPLAHGEAREQRRGQQSAARGGADQGEARQIQPHAAGVGSLVDDDVELEILHRRIEVLLDRLLQAMDFVDEEDVARFEVRQQAGQVARLLDGRPAGALEAGAHGFGDDVGQRGLAQTGRSVEQDVVERLAALSGGLHGDFEPLLAPSPGR